MRKEEFIKTELAYCYYSISTKPSDAFVSHCHAVYEIFYLIEGNIDYRVEGSEYLLAPGSILLIPPNVFHGVKVNTPEPYRRFSIHFLAELLDESERESMLEIFHRGKTYYPVIEAHRLEHFFSAVLGCAEIEPPLQAIAINIRIKSLLTQLAFTCTNDISCRPYSNRTVQDIVHYINEHLCEAIYLDTLAKKFFLSKNHINVIFRRATGTTVNQYIRLKRLAFAQKQILNGATAIEAAALAGFSDYSNFYRAYKSVYGLGPSKHILAHIE